MSLTSNFKKISDQLTNFEEIELIYYTINEDNDRTTITYNVICNLDNIISNEKLLKTIVATRDIIKTLYSKSGIIVDYRIQSLRDFEENLFDNDEYIFDDDLLNAQILYCDNELLSSAILKKQEKHTR